MENIQLGEAFIRRGATVAKVTDQYGEERIIYRQKGMKDLRIKNTNTTRILQYNRIASQLIAEKIKAERELQGLTYKELGELAGLKGTAKVRMYEIEKNTRKDGIRFGTLYAIANALQINIEELMPTVEEVVKYKTDKKLVADTELG